MVKLRIMSSYQRLPNNPMLNIWLKKQLLYEENQNYTTNVGMHRLLHNIPRFLYPNDNAGCWFQMVLFCMVKLQKYI